MALGALLLASVRPAAAETASVRSWDPVQTSPTGSGTEYGGILGSNLVFERPDYGFKAGEFVIQPRFFGELAYSTNFYKVNPDNGQSEVGMFSLHLKPGLAIFNPTYDIVALNFAVDADVRLPLVASEDTPGTEPLDQANVGLNARAQATFFPKGVVSFSIEDHFTRTLWTTALVSDANSNVNRNSLGADVAFHPGGRAIDISLGYRWRFERYDDPDARQNDRDDHHFRLLASWRFYPQTYAFLETTFDVVGYADSPTAGGNNVPGMPVHVWLGVSGHFTERLSALARVGYGHSILDRDAAAAVPDDFNSVLFDARLSYRFTENILLAGGASRDFTLTTFGGQRSYVRAYLTFEARIAALVLLHADAYYDYRQFGAWDPLDTSTVSALALPSERQDHVVNAGLFFDFDITRIFGMSLGYRFEAVFTDFRTVVTAGGNTQQVDPGYLNHRVYLSANLRY